MTYMVLHGRRSLQVATDRAVVPAHEVDAFSSALHCAQALSTLLADESERVKAELAAAREAGYAEGKRRGQADSAAELASALAEFARINRAQQQVARDAVCALALAVVRKLSASLGASEVVPALLENAIATLVPEQVKRVRVHPDVVSVVQRQMTQLEITVDVLADESLGFFACVVEDDNGRHLVGLEDQLAVIGKSLKVAPAGGLQTA